jgi:hypothetical protein
MININDLKKGDGICLIKEFQVATVEKEWRSWNSERYNSIGDITIKRASGNIENWVVRQDGSGLDNKLLIAIAKDIRSGIGINEFIDRNLCHCSQCERI